MKALLILNVWERSSFNIFGLADEFLVSLVLAHCTAALRISAIVITHV